MAEPSKETQKKEAEIPEKGERTRERRVYSPAVDIIERKDDIMVVADMPGADENSVDITLDKDVLTIYAKIEAGIPGELSLHLSEYGIGDYQRAFTLTDQVDREKIQAAVKNGVLRIALPKAAAIKARKIKVAGEA